MASFTPLSPRYQTIYRVGSRMPETFHWNMQVLEGKTYAERAEECRRAANVCPECLKESFLEMAVEYEQLAKKADEKASSSLSLSTGSLYSARERHLRRRTLDRDGYSGPGSSPSLRRHNRRRGAPPMPIGHS